MEGGRQLPANACEALREVREALEAIEAGASSTAVSKLQRAEAILSGVVDDPGGHVCDGLRELGVAAQGDPVLRDHLAESVAFLPLVVRACVVEGGEVAEVPIDAGGGWCELILGDTRVLLTLALSYAGALRVASLGGPSDP